MTSLPSQTVFASMETPGTWERVLTDVQDIHSSTVISTRLRLSCPTIIAAWTMDAIVQLVLYAAKPLLPVLDPIF